MDPVERASEGRSSTRKRNEENKCDSPRDQERRHLSMGLHRHRSSSERLHSIIASGGFVLGLVRRGDCSKKVDVGRESADALFPCSRLVQKRLKLHGRSGGGPRRRKDASGAAEISDVEVGEVDWDEMVGGGEGGRDDVERAEEIDVLGGVSEGCTDERETSRCVQMTS